MLFAVSPRGLLVAVVLLTAACSAPTATPNPTSGSPSSSSTASPTASDPGVTDLAPTTVAYLQAWAANDVPTMKSNSRAGSPARGYAEYWGRVFAAGRQDVGAAELTLRRRAAVLTYPDAMYRLHTFRGGPAGLSSWVSRPGGPLAGRVVSGPVARQVISGVAVSAHQQYVNTEGDLRITLDIRSAAARRVATPGYVGPDGERRDASLGVQARTGVVPVAAGASAALATVPDGEPGGGLTIAVYDAGGERLGRAVLQLPG